MKKEEAIQPNEEIPGAIEDYGEQSNRNSNLDQEVQGEDDQEGQPGILFTNGGMDTLTHQQAMMFQPQLMA